MTRVETNLFLPYRALGLVCSSVPPVFATVHKNGRIMCALEDQICLYNAEQLVLSTVTQLVDSKITLMAADANRFYAAFGTFVGVFEYQNFRMIQRIFVPNGGAKLLLALTEVLVVVDKANAINVFNVEMSYLKKQKILKDETKMFEAQPLLQLESSASFEITAIMHPHTYLNKILVGSSDGRMRIWNLRQGKLVHEFPCDDHHFNSAIRVLEQSTAIDVVGIGMADGQIHLRNIKFDKLLCTFRQSGQITALAFRTDDVDTLASANTEGSIAVWDLNERMLIGQLPEAHKGPITWIHFMLGQPFLLSAGEDNKIVKWFFRNPNSLPEVNKVLQGHSAPATALKFCSENWILSASQDGHVRRFNIYKMNGVKDFGLAREVRRGDLSADRFIDIPMESIQQMEVSHGRESVWDNMICRHEFSPLVTTWSSRFMRRGKHLLYHERFAKNPELLTAFVCTIFISNCGNFALIGYSSGHVDVFNMQSGKYKFSLEAKRVDKEVSIMGKKHKKVDDRAHKAPVQGVVLDLLNRHAVSGSSDGTIHFWQFKQPPTLCARMGVDAGVRLFRLDLFNSLLAVGLENGEIGVVDVLCRKLARKLPHYACMDWPKEAHFTALEFSNDGKWLLSADNQGFIKAWDLSSGILIDVVHCAHPCISLAFAEKDDYLATCHQGQRGIYLWANKMLFLTTESMFSTKSANELHKKAKKIRLPKLSQNRKHPRNRKEGDEESQSETNESVERIVTIDEDEDEEEDGSQAGTSSTSITNHLVGRDQQLDPQLLTLSGLAPSRWAGLPVLDLIRQRNKPKEPPKKAKSAPFFLPTVDTPEGFLFDKESIRNLMELDDGEYGASKRPIAVAERRLKGVALQSRWLQTLISAKTNNEFGLVFDDLATMSMSGIDTEIRSLNGPTELAQFLAMLIAILQTRRNFDLVQSYMATFLNIHYEALWNNTPSTSEQEMDETDQQQQRNAQELVVGNMRRLLELQKQLLADVQPLFDQSTSLAEFIRSALIM